MRIINTRQSSLQHVGIEGLLLTVSVCPFAFFSQTTADSWLKILISLLASIAFVTSSFIILRQPTNGKLLASVALGGTLAATFPYLVSAPEAALTGAIVYILAIYSLINFKVLPAILHDKDKPERALQRTKWSALGLMALSAASFLISGQISLASNIALAIAALVSLVLVSIWANTQKSKFRSATVILTNLLAPALFAFFYYHNNTWVGSLAIGIAVLSLLPSSSALTSEAEKWWDPFMNHPGRLTLLTFFLLCTVGTFLLVMPLAANNTGISAIDAAFTSVSAVCVTGLIVLDTPNDFSFTGQAFILLLIQLGGLGIMTISTVTLYALGKRISLRQERMLSQSVDVEQHFLADSLFKIVKLTAFMEFCGAIVLSILFLDEGFATGDAIWKGIFTAISAFCNAGFALQSDSLIPFQHNPFIIHTVAFLIICGGIAPAVTFIIPRWLSGKMIPVAARIALVTTVALLVFGTIFFLAFEWNGALANMSLADKLHNAWFQSVTLRTAGFNTVAIENVFGPTFIMMLCFMFIGGSPGGTAGGIKTTTFGVLLTTFWSTITGHTEICLQNRRVTPGTVYKAITTLAAGLLFLLLIIVMLQTTQNVLSRPLIFEAASALGTVGLSLGATGSLDSIGKVIIMLAMFAGRVGPLTLFTVLSSQQFGKKAELLEAKINLS
jgi:trk system potassium uptake protein TrkH